MLAAQKDQLSRRPRSPFFARQATADPPRRRYLIATTARSGSTFLCSRISDYAQLGYPMEFLNESYISQFEAVFPNPSLDDFESYVARAFCSPAGIFGAKTDWWRFQAARDLGTLQTLVAPLDLIVFLTREDFVAQAVSLTLAVETQVWHSRDLGAAPLETLHGAASYDPRKIKAHARNILNQEFHWRRFIQGSPAPCLAMTYEAVARDVDGAIRAIADAFDLRLGQAPSRSQAIEKAQSDVSRAWTRRFHEDCEDFVAFWQEYRGLISAA